MRQVLQFVITAQRRYKHGPTRQAQHMRSMNALHEAKHMRRQALDLVQLATFLASFLFLAFTAIIVVILLLVAITATEIYGNTFSGHLSFGRRGGDSCRRRWHTRRGRGGAICLSRRVVSIFIVAFSVLPINLIVFFFLLAVVIV